MFRAVLCDRLVASMLPLLLVVSVASLTLPDNTKLPEPFVINEALRMSKSLRIEITYDDFRDSEIAKEKGYHRRKFYCPHCDLLVRIETWDDHRMFGLSTIMKDNIMPNYCPNCGEEIICEGTTD
jgi:predicted RNA-binding Zn-ribbon protein involved in translation (DUF1610 family)